MLEEIKINVAEKDMAYWKKYYKENFDEEGNLKRKDDILIIDYLDSITYRGNHESR